MLRLPAVAILVASMVTGTTVGCGSDSCVGDDCSEKRVGLDLVGQDKAARYELCIDDDCRDLEQDPTFSGRFSTADLRLPDTEVLITARAFDGNGERIASFSERHTPPNSCCGRYLPLVFDGTTFEWRD